MRTRLDDVAGWVLLQVAAVLQRWVAGKLARRRWVARRNAAVRAASRRGVPVSVLAARLRWSPSWVRQVLNGKAEPDAEEAA
ncbi:hypothetical protein SMD44_00958 [Streptomyces alboflavus]|uniref:Uncharacterized protein n=1 Tax=Streptomyces alboflavus TaxID=67267 RepID=A0A1Z1W576_9ACTN|nr:hypothetical protein [Streptomyces alboflavus]ARX81560.1 hypothetical protein SMD44_00958 [Streptomyces alboflavus]